MNTQALTSTAAVTTFKYEPATTSVRTGLAANSRTALLEAAYRRVSEYRKVKAATPIALSNAWLAITYFTKDASATPQIGIDGEGGVEIEWLVDGRSLIVNSLNDGVNVLWALEGDGSIPFRTEFTPRFMSSDDAVGEADKFLDDLSARLMNRVPR